MQKRAYIKKSFRKTFSFILLTGVLCGSFLPLAAQTRRPPKPPTTARVNPNSQGISNVAAQKKQAGGGWSGVITYSQTLDDADSKKETSPNGRGESFKEWSHNVSYEGRLIVDGSDPKNIVTSGKVKFSEQRMQHEIEKSLDRCSAWKPEHEYIWDHKLVDEETGKGDGAAQGFNLYVDEARGNYSFSFTFAQVSGKYTREDHTKRSGWCQEKNNEPIDLSEKRDTVIRGESGSVSNQKIDPKNPDLLEGSVTIDNNDPNSPKAAKLPVTKFSWRLRRNAPPLIITDVRFYHLRFPSWNTWEEIENSDYTIDGNDVKIVATIANLSGAQRSATVNFKELKENIDLPQGSVAATFQPYEEREVEYMWDTSGFAWRDAKPWNEAEVKRRIEVRIPDDQKTEDIQVNPKPVILVPGLWSKPETFAKFEGFFNQNRQTPWAVALAPIYPTRRAAENAPVIAETVRKLQEKENAWHVDLVAHSTGGLGARAYIDNLMLTQYDNRPTATHLVMLGTPNEGTPCAAGVETVFTKFIDPTAESFREISVENMQAFNRTVTNRKGTKFSILVGNSVTPTCQADVPGDGVTPSRSAIWTIKNWKSAGMFGSYEELLGEGANFKEVYRWLAVSPKANHAPEN